MYFLRKTALVMEASPTVAGSNRGDCTELVSTSEMRRASRIACVLNPDLWSASVMT